MSVECIVILGMLKLLNIWMLSHTDITLGIKPMESVLAMTGNWYLPLGTMEIHRTNYFIN